MPPSWQKIYQKDDEFLEVSFQFFLLFSILKRFSSLPTPNRSVGWRCTTRRSNAILILPNESDISFFVLMWSKLVCFFFCVSGDVNRSTLQTNLKLLISQHKTIQFRKFWILFIGNSFFIKHLSFNIFCFSWNMKHAFFFF